MISPVQTKWSNIDPTNAVIEDVIVEDAVVEGVIDGTGNDGNTGDTFTIDNELVARTLIELANDGIDNEEWDDDCFEYMNVVYGSN